MTERKVVEEEEKEGGWGALVPYQVNAFGVQGLRRLRGGWWLLGHLGVIACYFCAREVRGVGAMGWANLGADLRNNGKVQL